MNDRDLEDVDLLVIGGGKAGNEVMGVGVDSKRSRWSQSTVCANTKAPL
jgi:hypothetical protein